MNRELHVAPDQAAIELNKSVEPEGERLRAELVSWIVKNRIVTLRLDTPEHEVKVDIVRLPPEIKPVLTLWGSIYVRNDRNCPSCESPAPHLHPAVQHEGEVEICKDAFHSIRTPENARYLPKPNDDIEALISFVSLLEFNKTIAIEVGTQVRTNIENIRRLLGGAKSADSNS